VQKNGNCWRASTAPSFDRCGEIPLQDQFDFLDDFFLAQLIEQFRLPIWYRIGLALFPVYLMLYVYTAPCRSLTSLGL